MTFEEALDRVIDYLAANEEEDYFGRSPRQRRNHIWRAVKVLMQSRDEVAAPRRQGEPQSV